mmetsp:Transcript_60247/g.123764  ORF Transcript_60247/g.123764 Transcript_60247/m.123764 type:complete len:94 (+) Transcript_60247:45-326(+)
MAPCVLSPGELTNCIARCACVHVEFLAKNHMLKQWMDCIATVRRDATALRWDLEGGENVLAWGYTNEIGGEQSDLCTPQPVLLFYLLKKSQRG